MTSHRRIIHPPEGGQGSICFPVIVDSRGLESRPQLIRGQTVIALPARRIPPKRRSVAGAVPFQSLGRMVRFESSLEGELLDLLAPFQPHLGVVEQPVRLSRKKLGIGRGPYTPDFLVWIRSEPTAPWQVVLVEVKFEEELKKDWKTIRPKLMAGRRFARRQGWRFLLVTERHLRRPPELIGAWPRIHQEAYDLVPPNVLLARLFGEGSVP